MTDWRAVVEKLKKFFTVEKIVGSSLILLICGTAVLLFLVFRPRAAWAPTMSDRERLAPRSLTTTAAETVWLPVSEVPRAARFLFFGDMMLDREVKNWLDKKGMDYLLADLAGEESRFFAGPDLIGVNWESALTAGGAHYPPALSIDFAVSDARLPDLKKYGFNFFNLANNHLTDQGERGVTETRELLTAVGIAFAGCPDKQVGDCSFREKEIGGVKTALAGFSMVYGVFDEARAAEIIADLKSRNDLVIVNIHWGVEYARQFNKKQQQIGRDLIDAGADVIIGHHPHVVQGMEIYKNKPIFYSLGNFIFDQYFSPETQIGLAVGFNYSATGTDFYLFPFKGVQSRVELLTGAEKEKFFRDFYAVSDSSVKDFTRQNNLLIFESFNL